VIAEWVNYGDLMKWAKLKSEVIKTGEFKDTGNPSRELTPAERAYMQSLIDNMFGQFIHAVADGRGLKYDDVKSIADGKVWTGQEALSMKLIDKIGDFQAVVSDTAKSVGISGEPTLVRPERDRRSLLDLMLGDLAKYIPEQENALGRQIGFYYLWK
jgi:protease IV